MSKAEMLHDMHRYIRKELDIRQEIVERYQCEMRELTKVGRMLNELRE